jgi:hypothetical protein
LKDFTATGVGPFLGRTPQEVYFGAIPFEIISKRVQWHAEFSLVTAHLPLHPGKEIEDDGYMKEKGS